MAEYPYQESNLDLALRRHPFYPLNYRDTKDLDFKLQIIFESLLEYS